MTVGSLLEELQKTSAFRKDIGEASVTVLRASGGGMPIGDEEIDSAILDGGTLRLVPASPLSRRSGDEPGKRKTHLLAKILSYLIVYGLLCAGVGGVYLLLRSIWLSI